MRRDKGYTERERKSVFRGVLVQLHRRWASLSRKQYLFLINEVYTQQNCSVYFFFRAVVVATHRQHQGGFVKGNIFVLTLIHMPFSTLIALRQKKYSALMDGKKIMLRSSRICFNSIACNHHYSLGVCLFSQQPLAKKNKIIAEKFITAFDSEVIQVFRCGISKGQVVGVQAFYVKWLQCFSPFGSA